MLLNSKSPFIKNNPNSTVLMPIPIPSSKEDYNHTSKIKWIKPKFAPELSINQQILKFSTLAPFGSEKLNKHFYEDLIPRSHLKMKSLDHLCYNEW